MTVTANSFLKQPQVAVGAVVLNKDRVLLVRRKNPPAEGQWAIPGGKQRWSETLQQAAEREVLEETGLHICAGKIVHTFEVLDRDPNGNLRFHYVIIDVLGEYIAGRLQAADDALEARWFSKGEIKRQQTSDTTLELLETKFGF